MNRSISKINPLNTTKLLLFIVFISACILSIKASYDLTKYSSVFPVWFVPSFIVGVAGLIVISSYLILRSMKVGSHIHLITDRSSIYLWVFMTLSFICITAVHSFYPFRFDTFATLNNTDSVLRINYTIAIVGFFVSATLATAYIFSPNKLYTITGLLMLALLTLIPNDNCSNPFNYWWIDIIGASPLMYVPNLFVAIFVVCGLLGVHTKGVTLLSFGACLGSLFLGIGHILKLIW